MKSVAMVLFIFASATNCLAVINTNGAPELKIWYELVNTPYGSAMSYLKDFDTARTRSAVAIASNPQTITYTWYNSHPYDTADYFRWKDGARGLIVPVDLNGDGVADYYDGSGNVYKGLANGRPPQNLPVAVGMPFVLRPFYGDYDGDGSTDLVFPVSNSLKPRSYKNYIGKIVFGNTNLDSVRTVDLPILDDEYQQLVGAYVAADGTPRILALVYSPVDKEGSIVLYKLAISKASGTYSVKYKIADAYIMHFADANEMFSPAVLCYTSDLKEHSFGWNKSVFSLENDKILLVRTSPKYGGVGRLLRNNCAADSVLYEVVVEEPDSLGNTTRWLALVQGNPRIEKAPFAKVPLVLKTKNNGALNIDEECILGDVNGDGVEDYAFHYAGIDDFGSLTRLRLCLGIGAGTGVALVDDRSSQIDLFPNRLSRSDVLHIKNNGPTSCYCEVQIFDMTGRRVAVAFRSELLVGSTTDISLMRYQLASGMYKFQVNYGEKVYNKTILID